MGLENSKTGQVGHGHSSLKISNHSVTIRSYKEPDLIPFEFENVEVKRTLPEFLKLADYI